MRTRTFIIILLVALFGSYLYIKLVWGSFGAFITACLIKSAIGIGCLVVILLTTLIISKINRK